MNDPESEKCVIKMKKITILDSTLRDGAQAEGVSFSVNDKLNICKTLDAFGVDYIEAGNPVSNPKDADFFEAAKKLNLKHAKIVAFSATCHQGISPESDPGIQSLVKAGTETVTIVGKSWKMQVDDVLGITEEENCALIEKTISYLVKLGKTVIFDAEHFFDGWLNDKTFALNVLKTAFHAGASILTLCDTNGGTLPFDVYMATKEALESLPEATIGIHCHNDSGCAVASSVSAVLSGADHVQGTINGIGERCGNADLSCIIPNLILKTACTCNAKLSSLSDTVAVIADIANLSVENNKPYIGKSAFAHKGGMHIDAVLKNPATFEHIDPETVGNERRLLMSEVSGRSTIPAKLQSLIPGIRKDSPETAAILQALKESEHQGYQYEAAEASLELMVMKLLGKYKPHFELIFYKIMGEYPVASGELPSFASLKIRVDGKNEITAETGSGPVNALDLALRKALSVFYPELTNMELTDYKVRVLEHSTGARVRVLMESTAGQTTWSTVGVSNDIIEASLLALIDSVEYYLMKLNI